ncbi:MAG: hypothetical protein CME32_01195 [Gimesia sp.]|nr:hypothetical protein [Gimesia sp.]
MESQSSFLDLLGQVKKGDQRAAARLYERFAVQLISKARKRLGSVAKSKLDPEDVVQSVYRSFFNRVNQGQFDLENWESLWSLLVTMTHRKCGRKVEYFFAEKRDVRKEIVPEVQLDNSDSVQQFEAIARDPSSEEATILMETLQQLLAGFKPVEREILSLKLQGYSQIEISNQVGRSERTIHRVLEKARTKLISEAF